MALILNLETSTTNCSVSIGRDGECVALLERNEGYSHAEHLALQVADLLKSEGIERSQLDAVCVGKGPGSFTGLRIGVSFAKGLSYGLQVPLLSIGTLDVLLEAGVQEGEFDLFIPTIDARRKEVYCAVFDADKRPLQAVEALVVDDKSFAQYLDSKRVLLFGDNASKLEEELGDKTEIRDIFPSAENMCSLAEKFFKHGLYEDKAYFEPYYFKDFRVGPAKKLL